MHADVEDQAPPPSPVRERMAAAIVAVALGVTSFVFTARAFRGGPDDPHPVRPATPTTANGLLAFSGAGIHTMSPDGTGVTNLTGPYDGDVVVAAYGPRWSLDGTQIAFEASTTLNGENACTYDIWDT
jgi:hypothetical protein